ncbi:methyltransferase domain-containing protein [Candidatus Poribacteria bacterium]|nr:methyltransferase domain-containing protein [Candidatus Poribacteria bacterium]
MKLNLGCGNKKLPLYVNVDIVHSRAVDVVADLNRAPFPFKNDSFEEVLCDHVLAHMDNFHRTIMEIVRITKDGGKLRVFASYFPSTKWFGDPDHKIPFGWRTFDGYTKLVDEPKFYEKWKLQHATNYGAGFPFIMEKRWFVFSNFKAIKWIGHIINLFPAVYDAFFCHWLPASEVCFVLRVDKRSLDVRPAQR